MFEYVLAMHYDGDGPYEDLTMSFGNPIHVGENIEINIDGFDEGVEYQVYNVTHRSDRTVLSCTFLDWYLLSEEDKAKVHIGIAKLQAEIQRKAIVGRGSVGRRRKWSLAKQDVYLSKKETIDEILEVLGFSGSLVTDESRIVDFTDVFSSNEEKLEILKKLEEKFGCKFNLSDLLIDVAAKVNFVNIKQ